MITRLRVTNFRALEAVDIPFSPLTAIVGPNGVGKTSILRAIDMLLGSAWPSMRSIRVPQDFTRFEPGRDLVIEVYFNPPVIHSDAMRTEHEIAGFRFVCRPYKKSGKWGSAGDLHDDFEPLDAKGSAISAATRWDKGQKPTFGPLRVSTGMREQQRLLFIDHRRSLSQHLPTARGSILSRLFEPARKEFTADLPTKASFKDKYEAAMNVIRSPQIQNIEETIEGTAKRMLGFLGERAVDDIKIGFGFADPANPFSSLRLLYTENGMEIPGEELGLGIQSAMVIGVFEAFRQLGSNVGTIVIEEPEMYLHPQAQRYFYSLLRELAESGKCQVVYSTHSPVFGDVAAFESIRLIRKEPGMLAKASFVRDTPDRVFLESQRKAQKMQTGFDAARNELLFARRAILVEGPGDRLAVQLVAQRLGKDADAEDLAIISCGAKSALLFFIRTCKALEIPCIVLHDTDIYPESGTPQEIRKIQKENAAARVLNQKIADLSKDVIVCDPTLEGLLGVGRRATDKPMKVVDAIEKLPDSHLPDPVVRAVTLLFS